MTSTESDKKELNRIRRKLSTPSSYGKSVEGVHTWDIVAIFVDFRKAVQIARRALRQEKRND